MKKHYVLIIASVIILLNPNVSLNAQNCASTSNYSYEWPSHRNWFMGASNGFTSLVVNMNTFAAVQVGKSGFGASNGGSISSYEGTSSISDDNGNLLFYQNGRRIFTGIGSAAKYTYTGLLEGNEGGATGNNASGTQGTIIVKHPLSANVFNIFTTDDANSPTVGLNYYAVTSEGTLISGPIRLGSYRTSEAIAATRHANGIDIWVTALDVTGKFNTYLIKGDGLDTVNSNLNQTGAPTLSDKNYERGGLAFSWDGKKMVQAHGNPTLVNQITIYDFDNSTGKINTAQGLNIAPATAIGSYDVVFSPDNKRIFVSRYWSTPQLEYYDISSGVASTIKASRTVTSVSCGIYGAAIEIGANGKLYIAYGSPSGGLLREINEDLNTSKTFTTKDIAGTMCSLALPTMYAPPTESPIISPVGSLCATDAAIDINTTWLCSGINAESTESIYSGTGITNPISGIFDPAIAGAGVHQIIFSRASVSDIISITVSNTGICDPLSIGKLSNNPNIIYPNPADDYLFVGLGSTKIYNIVGELVLTSTSQTINVSHLPSGIYSVSITNASNEVSTHKLVKK